MKRQDKSSDQRRFSAAVLRDFQNAYRLLERAVGQHPWLAQGSVNTVAPKSAGGNTTYTWTRKVRAKTVTIALSHEQSVAFLHAIQANRLVEEALTRVRAISQTALLADVPGVTKRPSDGSKMRQQETSKRELK